MAGRFGATVVIDRPIEEVCAFLADGENDPKFGPTVLEIAKTTDGAAGVGTVYASTVKDAGMKTRREFKLTEFEPPTRIRWPELSKNLVTAPEGGYDLAGGQRHPGHHLQRSRGARPGRADRPPCAAPPLARRPQGGGRIRRGDQDGSRGVLSPPTARATSRVAASRGARARAERGNRSRRPCGRSGRHETGRRRCRPTRWRGPRRRWRSPSIR